MCSRGGRARYKCVSVFITWLGGSGDEVWEGKDTLRIAICAETCLCIQPVDAGGACNL